jgi:6,7-dimethyl-8-ribityllumazine synthase
MKRTKATKVEFQLPDVRIGIIAARFNRTIVDGLLGGALHTLHGHGVPRKNIKVIHVPGAFEIPLAAQRMAVPGHYDGLIALGTVIRGETAHFEYVAGACTNGIVDVGLRNGVPIGFGVLTVNDVHQAVERAGPDDNNKGREAAAAVLEMVKLLRELDTAQRKKKIGKPAPHVP